MREPLAGDSVTAWAPGRVNIIGEHVDYNGGPVLPMAISMGCTARVTVTRGGSPELVIMSAQRPGEVARVAVAELAPARVQGWPAYVAGAVWAMSGGDANAGLSIEIDSDVPAGAGLSSSAAVECAVATAVNELLGLRCDRREIARRAQRAENEFVGVPTGSMDQVASMLARAGQALLFDVAADTVEYVPLDVAGAQFLVIDTKAHHALIDGGYADRRATCELAARVLGVTTLSQIAPSDLAAACAQLAREPDGERLVRRTRHVVTEIDRVHQAVRALGTGDLAELGQLMVASHVSLRDDYEVSCPELDLAVEAARQAGAWGARMTGGGFGGSALALVPAAALPDVCAAVTAAYAKAGFGQPGLIQVQPGPGACAR